MVYESAMLKLVSRSILRSTSSRILIASGARINGYVSREYIKDAGTPERLDRVRRDYSSGRIERGSLHIPAPAVFLDRDGTLNLRTTDG